MDRRGSGMGPMMPFFPGTGIDQAPTMSNPEMSSFPHMRDRFSNAVWGAENQGQWGAFHPPTLATTPMGTPSHPPHQFNQYEARQPVFNFGTAAATPQTGVTTSVTQFNSGFNGQYNGVAADPNVAYVPQGHFSPQTSGTSVQFGTGLPNGYLNHPQGNGVLNAPHPSHAYPSNGNEYGHQQQQQSQQTHLPIPVQPQQSTIHQSGVFKSPLPSPAVSAPEASPAHASYPMASPHGNTTVTSDPNSVSTSVNSVNSSPCQVPSYTNQAGSDCTSIPQASPHAPATPSNAAVPGNSNTTVQNRLKSMIMSRQGSNGSQTSSFSPGPALTESPPLGELRFSGSVAAVTSVASSTDASQVQESFKMAQNFLVYRTTGSDPGSVVQHTISGEKGSNSSLNNFGSISENIEASISHTNSTFSEFDSHNKSVQDINKKNLSHNTSLNVDGKLKKFIPESSTDSSKFTESKSTGLCDNNSQKSEDALEQLFKGTENVGIENLFRNTDQLVLPHVSQASSPSGQCLTYGGNLKSEPPDKDSAKFDVRISDASLLSSSANQNVPSSTHLSFTHLTSSVVTTSITSAIGSDFKAIEANRSNMLVHTSSAHNQGTEFMDEKSSNLSVYDFPDSPDQKESHSDFRLGRVRGMGPISTICTSTSYHRPTCSSVSSNSGIVGDNSILNTNRGGKVCSDGGVQASKSPVSTLPISPHLEQSFSSLASSAPANMPQSNNFPTNVSSIPPHNENSELNSVKSHITNRVQSRVTCSSSHEFQNQLHYSDQPCTASSLVSFATSSQSYSNMQTSTPSFQPTTPNRSHTSNQSFTQLTAPPSVSIPHNSQNIRLHSPMNPPHLSPQHLPLNSQFNANNVNDVPPQSSPRNVSQSPVQSNINNHLGQHQVSLSTSLSTDSLGTPLSHKKITSPVLSHSNQAMSPSSNFSTMISSQSSYMLPSSSMPNTFQSQGMHVSTIGMQSYSSSSMCPPLSHRMPVSSHNYATNVYQPFPYANNSFQPQFHNQQKFGPQMQMMQSPLTPFNSCHNPIKNMSNLGMPVNMMQPCLQSDSHMNKLQPIPPKKTPPKKPRKSRVTKKQKQQMEKQQKEEMERLKMLEIQQENAKKSMEKMRMQEIQMQQQHDQFQPNAQPFLRNKEPASFFNQQSSISRMSSCSSQNDYLSHQWPPHGFQSQACQVQQPYDGQQQSSAFSHPSTLPLRNQEPKGFKRKKPEPSNFPFGTEFDNANSSSMSSELANRNKVSSFPMQNSVHSTFIRPTSNIVNQSDMFSNSSYTHQQQQQLVRPGAPPNSLAMNSYPFIKESSHTLSPVCSSAFFDNTFGSQQAYVKNNDLSSSQFNSDFVLPSSIASQSTNKFDFNPTKSESLSSLLHQNIPISSSSSFLEPKLNSSSTELPEGKEIGINSNITQNNQEHRSEETCNSNDANSENTFSVHQTKEKSRFPLKPDGTPFGEGISCGLPTTPVTSDINDVNKGDNSQTASLSQSYSNSGSSNTVFESASTRLGCGVIAADPTRVEIENDNKSIISAQLRSNYMVNQSNNDTSNLSSTANVPSQIDKVVAKFEPQSEDHSNSKFSSGDRNKGAFNCFSSADSFQTSAPGMTLSSVSSERKPDVLQDQLQEPKIEPPGTPQSHIGSLNHLTTPTNILTPSSSSDSGCSLSTSSGPELQTYSSQGDSPFQLELDVKRDSDPLLPNLEERKIKLRHNQMISPVCSCSLPPGYVEPGPIYSHLGHGRTLSDVRKYIEERTGHSESEVRLEKVVYTGKEGKNASGCPLPKWIIRRGSPTEKVLVVVKNRRQHTCVYSWIVVVLVAWEGMAQETADDLYASLVDKLNKFGSPTERRCGTNDDRTCICQGLDKEKCGASFSFGCSWSMYYNMCKFARSRNSRKFKLTDEKEEAEVESKLQKLATDVAPLYAKFAPEAYGNQVALEEESLECRLGNAPGRPWTGVTACMDFCAHSHKDNHNMINGCTVIATLTKHRTLAKPDDEQYHVLPLYILDTTDEDGSGGLESFNKKVDSGSLEVLTKYPCEIRLRSEPLLSCRARNLLARGLPLPNTNRGRNWGRAKLSNIGNSSKGPSNSVALKRSSSVEEEKISLSCKKKDLREVSGKLGLDVDLLLKSEDLHSYYDDLAKYNIDNEDWHLDLEDDDGGSEKGMKASAATAAFGDVSAKEDGRRNSEFNGKSECSSGDRDGPLPPLGPYPLSDGTCVQTKNSPPIADQCTMPPPPPSLAPKRATSPGSSSSPYSCNSNSGSQVTTFPNTSPPSISPLPSPYLSACTPTIQPLSPHTLQSPVESSSSHFSPASHFSSFSPQMPSLSPHGIHSASPLSPASVKSSTQDSNVIGTASSAISSSANLNPPTSFGILPLTSCATPHFTASLNSPEMPRLSPHVVSSSLPSLSRPSEKPISTLALNSVPDTSICSFPSKDSAGSTSEIVPRVSENRTPRNDEGSMKIKSEEVVAQDNGGSPPHHYVSFSDNIEKFQDPEIGGVSIALCHRSVLFEFAKQELHATTALKVPDRTDPKRISLIFYHHKNLIHRNHGWSELEKKMQLKKLEVENLAKEGKSLPENSQKRKRPFKNSLKNKDSKVDHLKKLKAESPNSSKGGISGPALGQSVPPHPDLISPPNNFIGSSPFRPQTTPVMDSPSPFSPSPRAPLTPSFSLPSKSPHSILKESPALDALGPPIKQSSQSNQDIAFGLGQYPSPMPVPIPHFGGQQQELNPYHTPGSSPYNAHNHFNSPYMDSQAGPPPPSFGYPQPGGGGFYPKGPTSGPPLTNYNTTTYVPQPFYGLTPPYSPGPQQQQPPPHHIQPPPQQLPGGSFPPHHGAPLSQQNIMSGGVFDDPSRTNLVNSPTANPHGWPPHPGAPHLRHPSSFPVHGPYAASSPWPGS